MPLGDDHCRRLYSDSHEVRRLCLISWSCLKRSRLMNSMCACGNWLSTNVRQLPKIDDFSSLATILEQSLFFGGSLGRVGVDFRAILVVYFEDHVLELMGTQWRSASREFQDSLNAHALSSSSTNGGVTPSSYSKTPIVIASYRSAAYADGSSNGISPFASRAASANGEDYSPPHALMAFPILAEFTNALLTSLNELRLCTIASLQTRLAKKLQSTICAVILATAEFCEDNKLRISELTPNVDGQQNGNGDANPPSSKRQVLTEALQSTVEVRRQSFRSLLYAWIGSCRVDSKSHHSRTCLCVLCRSCARSSSRT